MFRKKNVQNIKIGGVVQPIIIVDGGYLREYAQINKGIYIQNGDIQDESSGGSLLLIPMACSLFGIGNDVAMQVVAVGFIIGVVQDSVETALNSSGDAMFTIASEMRERLKRGEKVEL